MQGRRKELIMRNNGWKGKVLLVIAFIIGVLSGLIVSMLLPDKFSVYRGLAGFGTIIIMASAIIVIGTKVFHIGE